MPFDKVSHYYKTRVNTVDSTHQVPAEIFVGDPDATKFMPKVGMTKWDGEAWLNIWYPVLISLNH